MTARKILFIAGDTSGDIHCARLAREIHSRRPDWALFAAGGEYLKAAGCRVVADTGGMGVIGFASAVSILSRALRIKRQVLAWLQVNKPDAAVLCDWGAFNARLLPDLRALGVKTLYYFPPRSWQKSGAGGLAIAPLCDRIATPFRWSAQRLNEAGARAEWVGHPLLEIVREASSREESRAKLGVGPDEVLVALLPGSRDMELRLIGPAMDGAADLLSRDASRKLRFVAVVPRGSKARAQKYLPRVAVREGNAAGVLVACDAALVKSGTATLEAAVANAPQVVCYDVPPLIRAQWKWTLAKKVCHVAMPNIILDRALVPELLGDACNAQNLARELDSLLSDAARRESMRAGYGEVRRALGDELPMGATARAAAMLEELVDA